MRSAPQIAWRNWAVLLIALVCVIRTDLTRAQAIGPYSEDAIKAVFLYRFAGFVNWPPDAAEAPEFTIGVLNADGIASELESLLSQHRVKDRQARVRRIARLQDIGDSKILYVGAGNKLDLAAVLGQIGKRSVLLVTDSEHSLEHGSMINFKIVDRHVRFEVSLAAAEKAGLNISSELLSVAIRVLRGDGTAGERSENSAITVSGVDTAGSHERQPE
ncbi:MAG: YfiR family protein [Steroidobacteraceae bacterium]|jgi:hypothetical protein